MHESSSTGSWSSVRACRIQAETWAIAGVVGLSCLTPASSAT